MITQTLSTQYSMQLLLLSGAASILWSSLLGLYMMIPHIGSPALSRLTKGVNLRQLLSAHLDWIMLALMQALAAGMIFAFDITPPVWVVAGFIYGNWMNAMPYFLRAFGINAFVFGGGIVQRTFAFLGGISVLTLIICWAVLIMLAVDVLVA